MPSRIPLAFLGKCVNNPGTKRIRDAVLASIGNHDGELPLKTCGGSAGLTSFQVLFDACATIIVKISVKVCQQRGYGLGAINVEEGMTSQRFEIILIRHGSNLCRFR